MIVCAMASFPPRQAGMMRAINDLLPQCDKMYVYLNGYSALPPGWPDDPKLHHILAGPGCTMPDVGSHGKMHWVGRDKDAYYATADDDIFYPPDYIAHMKAWLDKYERKVVLTMHGSIVSNIGGAISRDKHWWKTRTLYGYSDAIPRDEAVHQAGTAVSIFHPSTIGLGADFRGSEKGSGDDEDLAIWCQRHNIPTIRAAGKANWILPNGDVLKVQALHRNPVTRQRANLKMRGYRKWKIRQQGPTPPPAPPDNLAVPDGHCFDKIEPNAENYAFFNRILSSDALAAFALCAIKERRPLSVVRMADGERAIMQYGRTGVIKDGFLNDAAWLQRYGLDGADLKQVAERLEWAGREADFLACTISGTFHKIFNTHQFFPDRVQFVDQFYPMFWKAKGRVLPILRAAPVLIAHRDHELLAFEMRERYGIPHIEGVSLSSWRDHDAVLASAKASAAHTILLSGGAAGKALCVRIAKECGKVALDVGEALGRTWCSIMED